MRLVVVMALFGLLQTRSCGFEPSEEKGLGEPCTRSSECELDLVCRDGVCAFPEVIDAGIDGGRRDAGGGLDSSVPDAGGDAALDSGAAVDSGETDSGPGSDDSGVTDSGMDAAVLDAAPDSDGGG